jgi:hypothetical protein
MVHFLIEELYVGGKLAKREGKIVRCENRGASPHHCIYCEVEKDVRLGSERDVVATIRTVGVD